MVKPTIDELAEPKESIYNVQTLKGGSLIFVVSISIFTGGGIPHKRIKCRLF
jgi:hypothetical protein